MWLQWMDVTMEPAALPDTHLLLIMSLRLRPPSEGEVQRLIPPLPQVTGTLLK
jgi:hypothetical protein